MNRSQIQRSEEDHEAAALRSGLSALASLVTISPPPIAATRQRARKRRALRGAFQGASGVAATCAVITGVILWSPGHTASGPAPASAGWPSPTHTTPARPRIPSGTYSASTSDQSAFLRASDLGAGWTGLSPGEPRYPNSRPELDLGASGQCNGYYQPQIPVTPAPDVVYRYPADTTNMALEAIYTFAPGTGRAVMDKVRSALEAQCGQPKYVKLLDSPSTVADEAIVFTVGGYSRNILVRSGDRVASALVNIVPTGQEGTTWTDQVAKQMAIRLAGVS